MEDTFLNLGPHWGFIVGSYGAVLLVLAGLLAWVLLDERRLRKTLDRFEREGLTRRQSRNRMSGDGADARSPGHTLTQTGTQTGGETVHE